MESELLNQIILSSPNFIGFLIAILILNQQLKRQSESHQRIIELWRECERERRIQRLEQD